MLGLINYSIKLGLKKHKFKAERKSKLYIKISKAAI